MSRSVLLILSTLFYLSFLSFIGALSELKSLNTIAVTTNGLILHKMLKSLKTVGNGFVV